MSAKYVKDRLAAVVLIALGVPPALGQSRDITDLNQMSLEELANVEVTSVTKTAQRLSSAPAAIYVITRDEILRSGVHTLPDALRLAPNLQVTRLSSSSYAITARGFGHRSDTQAQANKLLVLIDGRTVYSPLFSGVFYDVQDVLLDDVERIEVISGPGATLWGANAMNGVINVITRSSASSQGTFVKAGAGNRDAGFSARHGGDLGDASYRVYATGLERGALERADESSAHDRWSSIRAGFHAEWEGSSRITLQSEGYRLNQSVPGQTTIAGQGAHALARWERGGDHSAWSVQAYYDWTDREAPPDGAPFKLHSYDLEAQHRFGLGAHRFVWGLGKRFHDYRFDTERRQLAFTPEARELNLMNLFVQDTFALGSFEITAGVKLEDNPFSDWEILPDLRISYLSGADAMIWAAASRAIRSATPFDVDVVETLGGMQFLVGNPEFRNERVNTYQLGYRQQPADSMSFSISAFYNDYENLRSIEFTPTTLLPLYWGNTIYGNTYGVEAWASLQATPWWRIGPSFRLLHKRLRFKPDARRLLPVDQTSNDPRTEAALKSSIDIGARFTFDAHLRYTNELPNPHLDDELQLTARIAWNVSRALQVSLTGFDLLDSRHREYPDPNGYIERSFFLQARWQR